MVVELELRTRVGHTVGTFKGNIGLAMLSNLQKNTDCFKKEMKNFKKGGHLTCYTGRVENIVVIGEIEINVAPYDYFIVNKFEL